MTCERKIVVHDPAVRRVVQTPGRDRVVVSSPAQTTITPQARDTVVVREPVTDVNVTRPVARVVEVVAEGPQGRPGAPGGSIPAIAFGFGDAPRVVYAPTTSGVLVNARLKIDAPFNGAGAEIRIGISGDAEAVLAAADSDPSRALEYENTPDLRLVAGQGVVLAITPGAGATAGAGQLFLTFLPD